MTKSSQSQPCREIQQCLVCEGSIYVQPLSCWQSRRSPIHSPVTFQDASLEWHFVAARHHACEVFGTGVLTMYPKAILAEELFCFPFKSWEKETEKFLK